MKNPASIANPGDSIVIPACSIGPEVDYECELAVVIGKNARNVKKENALEHVFGYTVANDVSARRWQKNAGEGQWDRGKSFDTFCPLGPCLVTADEIPNPQNLSLSTTLNTEIMQSSNTQDMIFTVSDLVSEMSKDMTLLKGSVILTGTPSGVGVGRNPKVFLKAGDEVTCSISNIGELTNTVINAANPADQ
jgi:2-keto-4-pentenoate hydratase/2-oxohepta-3-ene-1,7-dioic acid hydratase in catechol pathway